MPLSSDAQSAQLLLELMQAGDLRALDLAATKWGDRLLAVARRQCHLPADAEDAVQSALLAASRGMKQVRGDGTPLGWLSVLVARQCSRLNAVAASSGGQFDAEVPCNCDDDPSLVAERKQLADRLSTALLTLHRTDRLLFALSVEGFDSVELAERFDLTHDAVRGRLKRARQVLRAAFEGDDTLSTARSTSQVNPSPGATHVRRPRRRSSVAR